MMSSRGPWTGPVASLAVLLCPHLCVGDVVCSRRLLEGDDLGLGSASLVSFPASSLFPHPPSLEMGETDRSSLAITQPSPRFAAVLMPARGSGRRLGSPVPACGSRSLSRSGWRAPAPPGAPEPRCPGFLKLSVWVCRAGLP